MKPGNNRPGEGKFEGYVHNARVWLADANVRRLPIGLRGIYSDLLSVQWEEGYVVDDPQGLGKWLGARPGDIVSVLKAFFPVTTPGKPGKPGKRQNAKLEAQREHVLEMRKDREAKLTADRDRKRRGRDVQNP